jgi:signal transduction histidine kinase
LAEDLLTRADDPRIDLPPDAVVIRFTPEGIDDRPEGRLLYGGRSSFRMPARTAALDTAAALEDRGDYRSAEAAFRRAAESTEPSTQAAALVGLARTLRRDGRATEALGAYDRLASLGSLPVLDTTAALVARRARCAALAELASPALAAEAKALYDDLVAPTWRLDRTVFDFYLSEARQWLPPGTTDGGLETRMALADAVSEATSLETIRAAGTVRGWTTVRSRATPFVVVWQRVGPDVAMLVSGASWLASEVATWRAGNLAVGLIADGQVAFGSPSPLEGSVLVGPESGLPWTIRVAYDRPDRVPSRLSHSRYLTLAGLLAGGLLFVAGGVLVTRAVSRELAVARLQSDFVAAVSHEFRTPLTSMKHLIEMLAQGAVPNEERRQRYYDVLNSETDRLRRLVEDLLNFGRMEAGRAEPRFERLDVRILVRETASEFGRDMGAGARLIADIEGPPVAVTGDREALARAVRNLLDNAAKYAPGETPIHLQVGSSPGSVSVSVRDEGPGIPSNEQKRIFTKFYRGTGAKPGIRGTGLGLATVLHIARAHHGQIHVHSTPGRGSTFTIVLPRLDEASS